MVGVCEQEREEEGGEELREKTNSQTSAKKASTPFKGDTGLLSSPLLASPRLSSPLLASPRLSSPLLASPLLSLPRLASPLLCPPLPVCFVSSQLLIDFLQQPNVREDRRRVAGERSDKRKIEKVFSSPDSPFRQEDSAAVEELVSPTSSPLPPLPRSLDLIGAASGFPLG
eukprot:765808-Hanusia_phi.AAC.2